MVTAKEIPYAEIAQKTFPFWISSSRQTPDEISTESGVTAASGVFQDLITLISEA